MQSIGITINCSGNCSLASSFQNYQCVDLFNELGIQQCNQASCSPRTYNLSACITPVTGLKTNAPTTTETIKNIVTTTAANTNEYDTHRVETLDVGCNPIRMNGTEMIPITCTSRRNIQQLSNTVAALGVLVGLLMMLLVVTIIPWIWIWWRLKLKGGLQRDIKQAR